MAIVARIAQLIDIDIASLRESYREEMKCQIIHDSIHVRSGWTREYALELNGTDVGYGSVAIAGPWCHSHALYEFYVQPAHRMRTFYFLSGEKTSMRVPSGSRKCIARMPQTG